MEVYFDRLAKIWIMITTIEGQIAGIMIKIEQQAVLTKTHWMRQRCSRLSG